MSVTRWRDDLEQTPPPYCLVPRRDERHAIESNTVKYLAEIRFVTTIFINIYGLEEQLKCGGGFLLQQVRPDTRGDDMRSPELSFAANGLMVVPKYGGGGGRGGWEGGL